MRLPKGTGAAYHALKWLILASVFGMFAANLIVPAAAIFFLFVSSDILGFLLTGGVWAAAVGVMLWLVSRQGRRTRRQGADRPHTDEALGLAHTPRTLRYDYELLDIGIKPWRSGNQVLREEALPDDMPGLFPTIRLWMRRSYIGRLTVEFHDAQGNLLPQHTRSRRVLLLAGHRNIVFTESVTPSETQRPSGEWTMSVLLNDQEVAVHPFEWYAVGAEAEPPPDASFVYPHATLAARQAGGNVQAGQTGLTDVGLLVWKANREQSIIYRTEPIPPDVTAVQPFVRFNLPARASGQVRFVLRAPDGSQHLTATNTHDYTPGDNLIVAKKRFRMDDIRPLSLGWSLDVFTGETHVASHTFDWEEALPDILDPLEQDGELSSRLQERFNDPDDQISLRDLLNEQRRRR